MIVNGANNFGVAWLSPRTARAYCDRSLVSRGRRWFCAAGKSGGADHLGGHCGVPGAW